MSSKTILNQIFSGERAFLKNAGKRQKPKHFQSRLTAMLASAILLEAASTGRTYYVRQDLRKAPAKISAIFNAAVEGKGSDIVQENLQSAFQYHSKKFKGKASIEQLSTKICLRDLSYLQQTFEQLPEETQEKIRESVDEYAAKTLISFLRVNNETAVNSFFNSLKKAEKEKMVAILPDHLKRHPVMRAIIT